VGERTLRGKVAIVGVGETEYYEHGRAPDAEPKLARQAILRACDDAGIAPRQIDGFAFRLYDCCMESDGARRGPPAPHARSLEAR
jgi:hypothetical protein